MVSGGPAAARGAVGGSAEKPMTMVTTPSSRKTPPATSASRLVKNSQGAHAGDQEGQRRADVGQEGALIGDRVRWVARWSLRIILSWLNDSYASIHGCGTLACPARPQNPQVGVRHAASRRRMSWWAREQARLRGAHRGLQDSRDLRHGGAADPRPARRPCAALPAGPRRRAPAPLPVRGAAAPGRRKAPGRPAPPAPPATALPPAARVCGAGRARRGARSGKARWRNGPPGGPGSGAG